jgi:hypothetical protein
MKLSALDWMLWGIVSLGLAILFIILLVRRRWSEFPVFTAYMGFDTLSNAILYAVFRYGSHSCYKWVYYTAALIEFFLQLGVVWEIARVVMRPTGSWVRDAKKQFILWGAGGILLAAALPWLVTPPAPSLLARLEVRGNLFTSLVICELIAVLTRTSKSLGLGWRNHVMALGNGWTAWAVIAILVDGLHSYFGAERYFYDLEHVRTLAYLIALCYWSVQFWLEEPARRPISPELSNYIQALHRRINFDLDTLNAQR